MAFATTLVRPVTSTKVAVAPVLELARSAELVLSRAPAAPQAVHRVAVVRTRMRLGRPRARIAAPTHISRIRVLTDVRLATTIVRLGSTTLFAAVPWQARARRVCPGVQSQLVWVKIALTAMLAHLRTPTTCLRVLYVTLVATRPTLVRLRATCANRATSLHKVRVRALRLRARRQPMQTQTIRPQAQSRV